MLEKEPEGIPVSDNGVNLRKGQNSDGEISEQKDQPSINQEKTITMPIRINLEIEETHKIVLLLHLIKMKFQN